ncbi:MAG: glutaminyl-peptide cyclotransferase [Bacteroidetes bacterium]|nr:glutaminyl-peptide cyclotransferase [Bacteroidota bacterium]
MIAKIKRTKFSHIKSIYTFAILIFLFTISCTPEAPKPEDRKEKVTTETETKAPLIPFTILKAIPHDSTSFTEGLLFHNGKLFESTGAAENYPQTRSLFGIVNETTGKIEVKAELDKVKYFGEGISILNNKIFQLTYKNQIGFIYDATTFKPMGQFGYFSKEGWGMTTDGKNLIMSDGTNVLTYLNPTNFQITKTLAVSENNYAVDYLNELEYIKGYIYANVYMTNSIVKIDPSNGNIVGRLEITNLFEGARKRYAQSIETNGIAYDSLNDRVLVTGKLWPILYEIKFQK